MKPTINSNRIVRSRATTRECGCHGIALLFLKISSNFNFQDPNGPFNIEYSATRGVKAANKIVKQASNKGRTLKAQQRKYSVSHLQSNASSNSSVGVGISLWIQYCFTARDRHLGLVRVS